MDTALQNEELDGIDLNVNEIPISSSQSLHDNEEKYEVEDATYEQYQKSTFRNILQAKKRLQAFSVQKQVQVSPSTSKNKLKTVLFVNEKSYNEKGELQESMVPLKKPQRKAENPIDKAKAVIEEIEVLKKIELLGSTPLTIEEKLVAMSGSKRSRSRSKSSERDFVFRKREKKVRNYRRSDSGRRSPSPLITKAKEKPSEKTSKYRYPKNWEEFTRDKWTFEKFSKMSHSSGRNNNIPSDITKQLLFKTPPDLIKPYYYKDDKGEEVLVPYKFLRYTSAEPRLSYNVNPGKIKDLCLNRGQILSKTHKNYRTILEKFLGKSTKTKIKTTEPIGQRNWYQRCWKENESKILETSIGLSFLQNYSDDDDEEEEELILDLVQPAKFVEIPPVVTKEKSKTKTESINISENIENKENVRIIEKERFSERREEDEQFSDRREVESKNYKTELTPTDIKSSSLIEEEIKRNRTKSEDFYEEAINEEDAAASWTPERIVKSNEDEWDETPKKKTEKSSDDGKKNKKKIDTNADNIEEKQRAREIHSEDEWDETPKRKKEKSISEEIDVKKIKKKKNKKKSPSESSSSEEKKKSKKKKKLDKKKKQREKEKKARKKKEKLKAEKLKLKKEKKKKKKQKEREAEKEILKKLKKEIENSLEEVEREEREKIKNASEEIIDVPVKVKIEKEEKYEEPLRPVEDLRNFLDKKVGKMRGKVEEKTLDVNKSEEIEALNIKTKETSLKDKKKSKNSITKEMKREKIGKKDRYKEKNEKYDIQPNLGRAEEGRYEEKNEKYDIQPNLAIAEEEFPLEKNATDDLSEFIMSSKDTDDNAVESKENLPQMTEETEEKPAEKEKSKSKSKSEKVLACETTPDTDEYHSNWESDDGISPIVKRAIKKVDRSWESEEEIFEIPYAKKEEANVPFGESPLLEMPLHIKKFSRRDFDRRESKGGKSRSRTRSPEYLDVDSEIKLLEEERINLSKERMSLEIERMRIHELERKKSMEEIEYINEEERSPPWEDPNFGKKQDRRQSRWDLREDHVDSSTSKHRKEKTEDRRSTSDEKGFNLAKSSETVNQNDTNYSSQSILSISSSPEITSTKSPTPTVLENAYQEFMKAVSVGEDSKDFLVISSTDSDEPSSNRNQKKTRLTRSERNRNRDRNVRIAETKKENDNSKLFDTTDPKLLKEILLPGEVPIAEIPMPMPMPVPSPKLDALQNLPPTIVLNVTPTSLVQELILEPTTPQESPKSPQKNLELTPSKKPFSFSTLKLPKKPVLLEKSNWKVDEDSEEDLPPAKKTLDDIKMEHENPLLMHVLRKEEFEEKNNSVVDTVKKVEEVSKPIEEKLDEKKVEQRKVEKVTDVKERDKRKDVENKKKDERSSKRKHSRSRSPVDASKDKRRKEEDSRKKEDDSRRKEDDSKKKEDDFRKKEEQSKRRDVDNRRKEDDARRKQDDARRKEDDARRKEDDARRREDEMKRRDRGKRISSPQKHKDPSPRRRRLSSPSHRRSPRYRSPPKRQDSSRRPDRGDRPRSSPLRRRRSHSPPKQSTASRRRSPRWSKSPGHSPVDRLKRSVADSTISDDLLPQPYMGESSNSPLCSSTSASTSRRSKITLSPKRPSLDERINQVLGIEVQPQNTWQPMERQEYSQLHGMAYSGYHQQQHSSRVAAPISLPPTSKVLQIGNILQVVPTEDISIPPPVVQSSSVQKIVQVGNMLQIVPTEMDVILPPLPPPPPPAEDPIQEEIPLPIPLPEKQSAEAILTAKNAERMAERAKKRLVKEERKKEKERRKKDKDKRRKMRLKTSTEEIIKRALELDGFIENEHEDLNAAVPEIISDTPGLDPSKSILLNSSTSRYLDDIKSERRKSVQFADGIRPGEGTSPSGGEELSSPPPQTEVLPKPKRFRKIEASKKKKRKIKVKVIKKRQPSPDSDEEYENLPPPSPPPGSPPPHLFPARVKVHTINNIPQHYLPAFGVTTAPQQPLLSQPPPGINLGYQIPPTAVYRTPPPPPPTHVSVIGQHFARASHAQPPQHMHPHGTAPISHRDHQPYSAF